MHRRNIDFAPSQGRAQANFATDRMSPEKQTEAIFAAGCNAVSICRCTSKAPSSVQRQDKLADSGRLKNAN
jgi:hypothetical protein